MEQAESLNGLGGVSMTPRRPRSQRTPNPAWVAPEPVRRDFGPRIAASMAMASVEFLGAYNRYADGAGVDVVPAAVWRVWQLEGVVG